MALLDVLLFVLIEELLPHVLQWKDRKNNIFQVIFLNKGNPQWDSTYISLFKIMDSFNKSKYEVYSSEPKYETNSKRRFMSNIQKFVTKKELICHPEEKDGGKKIHVLEINFSEEEILLRISNLSEQEKQNIRHMVMEDELNKTKGTKRNSPDHSPSPSKKFKSSTSFEDLPSTSAEVLPHPVTSSSVDHNQSSVINCFITNNYFILPVEAMQNLLINQLLNQIGDNEDSPPPHPIDTNGPGEDSPPPHPNDTNGPGVRIQDSSNPHLYNVLDPTSYPNETPSDERIPVPCNSYDESNPLALNSNLNNESFYPQSEARPLGNNELCVNNNNPVVELPDKKSEIDTLEDLWDILNGVAVDNEEGDNFERSILDSINQGVEERPLENLEHGVINNENHFSFPDFVDHGGTLGETEPSFDLNDLTEFNNNHCGSL